MQTLTDGEDDSVINPIPDSDTPVNLRPDLSVLGIEEVDRGICHDTAENRQILRSNKLSWIAMFDRSGHPTNNIEVRSADMITQRGINALEGRKAILVDIRNKNSDYLTGLDLLYETRAGALVPSWILSATRAYMDIEEQRAAHPEKKIKPALTSPPGRCVAIKSDGVRCMLWHSGRGLDGQMCRIHLGSLRNQPGAAIERARTRVQQSAPHAVDILEELMDSATSEQVRLKASTEILDRAGIRGGMEIDQNVNVTVRPAADIMRERLEKLRNIQIQGITTGAEETSETVEAEIVEDA